MPTYFAAEEKGERDRGRQLGVDEADEVQQVRVGRRLQEEPARDDETAVRGRRVSSSHDRRQTWSLTPSVIHEGVR